MVQKEPPHLDLHCLPIQSLNSKYDIAWTLHFFFSLCNLQTKILSSAFSVVKELKHQESRRQATSYISLRIQRLESKSVDPDEALYEPPHMTLHFLQILLFPFFSL